MKAQFLLLIVPLFSACSGNNDTIVKEQKILTPESSFTSKEVLAQKLSNDKNFINMMDEIYRLQEDLDTEENKYIIQQSLDLSKLLEEVKTIKSKEGLKMFYGRFMTNPEIFVMRLTNIENFTKTLNSEYSQEFNKITDSERNEVTQFAIDKYNINFSGNLSSKKSRTTSCLATCNWVWGQQEMICNGILASGVSFAGYTGFVGGPAAGEAAFLVAGVSYYYCSYSNEINLIGCVENC